MIASDEPRQKSPPWLNPRRIRAHAILLALSLWGICALDYATPGIFDRAGNIKFQDFLPFYISSQLIAQHRADQLYDPQTQRHEIEAIVGQPTRVEVPNLYGPQVGLLFVPLAGFSFSAAAGVWAALGVVIYFVCVYAVWKDCPALRAHAGFVVLAACAFPPLFHVFVRAQISALILACFTAALLAFRADRSFLAGIALGVLILKPQFLIAIPLILLFAQAWSPLAGLLLSAAAQLSLARLYFGSDVMRAYLDMFLHPARWIGTAELSLAPIQMHSLRSFWSLLIPSSDVALALYALSSLAILAMAAVIFRCDTSLPLRFSSLILAAILVNPHLFVYDLIALVPVLLLIINWTMENPQHPSSPLLRLLCYLAFILPLFGPLSRWTHFQLSVVAFVGLQWTLFRFRTAGHKLASHESRVV